MHSPLPEDQEPKPKIRAARWPSIARRIRVPLSFALAVFYCWLSRPTAKSIVFGALVAIPGLLIRALASGHVQKNEQLTTSGPYAYTRNPLYLGSMILAGGFAIAARSWVIVVAMSIIFIAIYLPVILSEEAFLRRNFAGFDEYASRVPRLLPRHTAPVPGRRRPTHARCNSVPARSTARVRRTSSRICFAVPPIRQWVLVARNGTLRLRKRSAPARERA